MLFSSSRHIARVAVPVVLAGVLAGCPVDNENETVPSSSVDAGQPVGKPTQVQKLFVASAGGAFESGSGESGSLEAGSFGSGGAAAMMADESGSAEAGSVVGAAMMPAGAFFEVAVPTMHCPYACYPSVREQLEATPGVLAVSLASPEDAEDGTIEDRRVFIMADKGFDSSVVADAVSRAGHTAGEVTEVDGESSTAPKAAN